MRRVAASVIAVGIVNVKFNLNETARGADSHRGRMVIGKGHMSLPNFFM